MSIIKQDIWNFLINNGLTEAGAAGLMGNLMAESNLNPRNMEDIYQNKLGYNDNSYTDAVDNNTYLNFIHDCVGYGLAQWTWYTRKEKLLKYAQSKNVSIGDLNMQLEFLIQELQNNYTNSVYKILITTDDIKSASDTVLLNFECPIDTGDYMKQIRYNYSKNIYDELINKKEDILMVQTYQKGKNTQLSENFVSKELDCKGYNCCSETFIDDKLITYLQKIRKHFGKQIIITSGYRCPTHNKRVGGATGSYHTQGKAADIVVQNVSPREVAKYAESIGVLGIGLYETSADGYFVHIDTRTSKSFWYGQSQQYRSTFGGTPIDEDEEEDNSNNTGNASTGSQNSVHASSKRYDVSMPYYQYGDRGEDVKIYQGLLLMHGYKLGDGGADGIFGNDTLIATKNFQKDNGLTADGVAGHDTMVKLLKI